MAKRKSTPRNTDRQSGTRRKSKAAPKRRAKDAPAEDKPIDGRQRLQRVMASAGIASRRECEIIIQEGRVEVDGRVVTELGLKVDPSRQEIVVDAEKLVLETPEYFMLNKPPGVVSTSQDPSGRVRVIDLIDTRQRVYNVGRLDRFSEGLILVTNDGQLAHRLTHPRYGVEKIYHVQVDGRPTPGALKQLQDGVYLADGKVHASGVRYLKRAKNGSWLEIVLTEGKNREIRRMLAAIGHKVRTLKRVAIGPLRLKDLPVGAHRQLTAAELRALKKATSGPARRKPARSPGRRGKPVSAAEVRESRSGDSSKQGKRRSPGGPKKRSGKSAPAARGAKGSRPRRSSGPGKSGPKRGRK